MMNKISFRYIFTSIILLISSVIIGYIYLSIPTYQDSIVLPIKRSYIKDEIRINRDQYGIPHIKAKTMIEAFYGKGYVHGVDRTWQLHLRRVSSQGRLSEVFGAQTIHIDKHIRNLGLIDSAKRVVKQLDKFTVDLLQAYIDGINDGVRSLSVLPIEFQILRCSFPDWTIYDSLTFYNLMAFINVNDAHQEFIRSEMEDVFGRNVSDILGSVGPDNQFDSDRVIMDEEELKLFTNLYDKDGKQKGFDKRKIDQQNQLPSDLDLLPKLKEELFPSDFSNWLLPSFTGSNLFVIHGNHTTTGKPIIASDPHLETQMPCLWYQQEIIFDHDGEENYVIGASLPGIPITLSGRSKHLSWGLTILYSDCSELWQEEIVEKDGKIYYKYKDELIPVRETEEIIVVRGQEDIKIKLLYTHHGAIMNSDEFRPKTRSNHSYIAIQSVIQIDDLRGMKGFFELINEKDMRKAMEHLKQFSYPNLAMGFASENGDIGFLSTGRLVIKTGNPDEGAYVKQGWLGNDEWQGYLSFEDQPLNVNPPKGYIVLSNNKYLHSNNKYNLGWNSHPTSRGRRIDHLISQKIKQNHKFSVQDVKDIQNDVVDSYAEVGVQNMIQLVDFAISQDLYKQYLTNSSKVKGLTNNDVLAQTMHQLNQWNSSFQKESVGASIYTQYEYHYFRTFAKQLTDVDTESMLLWANHYIFDSFNIKNLQDMLESTKTNKNQHLMNSVWCGNHTVSPVKSQCLFNIIYALVESYSSLHKQLGSDLNKWQWQNIHTHYLPHMPFKDTILSTFFDRKFPYQGNRRTVHLSAPNLKTSGEYIATDGPNYKMVISMDKKDKSYYIIDTGISGNIFSPHYDDQQQLYKNGEYIQMTWGSENINNYKYTTIIKPFGSQQKVDI